MDSYTYEPSYLTASLAYGVVLTWVQVCATSGLLLLMPSIESLTGAYSRLQLSTYITQCPLATRVTMSAPR